MEDFALVESFGPPMRGDTVHCAWCDSVLGTMEEDSLQFDLDAIESEGEENPMPANKETEEGAKAKFNCPECGTDNILHFHIPS